MRLSWDRKSVVAETGLDVIRWNPQPGVDQPDVAPGTPMAGAMGLQDTDTLALLAQVNRRRQTGDTRTNHTDVDAQLTLEARRLGPLRRQLFP